MKAALTALALVLAVAPAQAAPPKPKPKPPAGPLRSTIYKLPAPLRANAPAWLGSLGKLAFLGNQAPGQPADVYLWDPKLRQMGRATEGALVRHSLTAATDGRLAYVEQGGAPAAPPPGCLAGNDRIVVYDFGKGTKKPIFEGGNVQPDTLWWSHDGQRLAFLTRDANGASALALLESGKPLTVTRMPVNFALTGLLGWVDDHEVMAQATSPQGQPVFLRVGSRGMNALPPGPGPKLAPDGRYLLTRLAPGFSVGVALRGAAGGGRTLHRTAGAYGWGPNDQPVVSVGAAANGVDDLVVSPDGRFVALLASHVLTVLAL